MAAGDRIGPALVRVRGSQGSVIGTGFLIAPTLVITCAHVVGDPDSPVELDFPLLPGRPSALGEVVRWEPVAGDETGDVAVLRVRAPEGAVPAPSAPDRDVWGHGVRVFGFPRGFPDGRWLTGTMRTRQGTGWLQVELEGPASPGFSGAPVWDEDAGGVVGMLVAGTKGGTAFVLPGEDLGDEWVRDAANPFRGLAAFQERDAPFFHGRAADGKRLYGHVREHALVLVAGSSGSGKSSLVRAGLLPAARADGVRISVLERTPGATAGAMFADLVAGLAADTAADGPALVFVDQFEEVVAEDPASARELLGLVIGLISAGTGVRAVLTVRSDSLDDLLTAESVELVEHGVLFVGSLGADALRDAITGPVATAGGTAFEDGLVERIVVDAGLEPGRLPLVEFALTELWRRRRGGLLTHAAYDGIGRVAGALTDHADKALWHRVGDQVGARRILTRLVHPEEFTRRRIEVAEVGDRALLARLTASRLVVVSEGGTVVELAHQALIDRWERLRDWLVADRDFLLWRAELDQRRTQWEDAGRDRKSLLAGVALARAIEWRRQRPRELSAADTDFILRGRRRARREVWRWRTFTAVAVVLALVAVVLAKVALDQRDDANAGRMAQESQRLAARDPVTALQLAVGAWHESPGNRDAHAALLTARLAWTSAESFRFGETSLARSAANGSVTAVVRGPGQVEVRTASDTWQVPARAESVELSPDGTTLAVVDTSGAVQLWDVVRRTGPVALERPAATEVVSVAFDATGTTLTGLVEIDFATRWPVVWDTGTTRVVWRSPGTRARSAVALPERGSVLVDDHTVQEVALATHAVVTEFGPGTRILGNGEAVARCEAHRLVLRLTGTGEERGSGFSCGQENQWRTDASGEFVMAAVPADEGTLGSVIRYLHWRSGKVFTVRATIQDDLFMGTGQSNVLASDRWLTPTGSLSPDGTFRVELADRSRSAVLRADRPDFDLPRDIAREHAPNGVSWLGIGKQEVVLVHDGEVTARTTIPTGEYAKSLRGSVTFTEDGHWVVVAAPDRLVVHRATDLAQVRTMPLPAAVDNASVTAVSGAEVAVLREGVITRWRADTGEPVGRPLELASTPLLPEDDRARGGAMRARPGHPHQFVVALGLAAGVVDLDTGTVSGVIAIAGAVVEERLYVHPTGSPAVAAAVGDEVVLWDLDTGQVSRVSSTATVVLGSAGVNHVLRGRSVVQVWRSDGMVASLDLPPDTWGEVLRDGRLDLITAADGGQTSVSLPVEPERLFRELCDLADRPYTDHEKTLLPAGADDGPPCRG
ncbi:trypsin-like peptidase domain-containing protein [Actinosynnema sp. CA-299493]